MRAGGSRTLPAAFDAQLTVGCRMLALGGDFDLEDIPTHHVRDWRPAPSEDCEWRSQIVDAAWSKYREGRQ